MTFRIAVAIFAAMLLVATVASAQNKKSPPAFEFRGHHIGEPIEKHFSYWADESRDPLKRRANLPSVPYCGAIGYLGISCPDEIGAKELDLRRLSYRFLDGKLYSIEMETGGYDKEYGSMLRSLKAKYGEPAGTQKASALGNDETFWTFREGILVLVAPSLPGVPTDVKFRNPAAEKIIKQRKEAEDVAKARKF